MSTQTVRPVSPGEATATALAPWNLVGDLGRQQFALATESACAMFRGSEATRKIKGADHAVATAA